MSRLQIQAVIDLLPGHVFKTLREYLANPNLKMREAAVLLECKPRTVRRHLREADKALSSIPHDPPLRVPRHFERGRPKQRAA